MFAGLIIGAYGALTAKVIIAAYRRKRSPDTVTSTELIHSDALTNALLKYNLKTYIALLGKRAKISTSSAEQNAIEQVSTELENMLGSG